MQTFLLLLHLSAQLSRQPNRFKQKQNKQISQNSSPLKVIRRRDLWHGRERVPPALKKREWRDQTVRDFPELRVADISISVAELHLDRLPIDLGDSLSPSPELLLLVLRVMFLCFYLHLHLRYSVSYVLFFFFFLGVMMSWDFLSKNDEHILNFIWNRFLYIEIDFTKLRVC